MINLIKADFYKINRSAIYKVLFILSAVCAVAITCISHFTYTGDLGMEAAGSAALLTDVVMLNLISCVIAGQLICGDFENKLIQSSLTGCSNRFTVVCAKMLTYMLLNGIMTLPYALCGIIGFCLDKGYSAPISASAYLKMLFEANSVDFSASVLLQFIAIALMMMLVYTAQSGLVFVLAFLVKNKALIVTAVGFILCTILGMMTSLASSGDGVFNKTLEWTPYSGDIYALSSETEAGTMIKITLACLAFIAAYTGIAYGTFRNAEVK